MISSNSQAHGIKHLIVENIHVVNDCHIITENHRNNFIETTDSKISGTSSSDNGDEEIRVVHILGVVVISSDDEILSIWIHLADDIWNQ